MVKPRFRQPSINVGERSNVLPKGQPLKAQDSRLSFGMGGGTGNFPYRTPEPYHWSAGEKLSISSKTGESTYSISAFGYAWDRAADKVIGMTTKGRLLQGQVVSDYWILLDLDVAGIGSCESVVVQDQQGKTLHTYTRTD